MKQKLSSKIYPALGISFRGFEHIGAQEVTQLLGLKAQGKNGFVFFSATQKQLVQLCYFTQTLRGVQRILFQDSFEGTLSSLKEKFLSLFKKEDFSFLDGKTFKVVCDRSGEHSFGSQDAAAVAGECVLHAQKKTSVSLTNPDYILSLLVQDNTFFFCIDFAGVDLSKREYRIYSQQNALNTAFAANVVLYSGYTPKKIFLDPCCGIGLFCIEAGLHAGHISSRFHQKDMFAFQKFLPTDLSTLDDISKQKISVEGYDVHLRHVEAAKKHAKLAGIAKLVSFARGDIEWIDTKVDEKSVDIICTYVPSESPQYSEKDLEKFFKEFYYQLEFVLKESGKMILVCQKMGVLKRTLEYFSIVEEHTAWQGELQLHILTLKKK